MFARGKKPVYITLAKRIKSSFVDRIGSFRGSWSFNNRYTIPWLHETVFPDTNLYPLIFLFKDRYGRDTYRELSRDLQSTTIGQLRRYKLLLHLRKLMVVFVYLYSRAVNRIAARCSSSFCPTRLDENEKFYRYRARRLMMIVENGEIFVKLHGVDESSSEARRIMPCEAYKNILHMKKKKKKDY